MRGKEGGCHFCMQALVVACEWGHCLPAVGQPVGFKFPHWWMSLLPYSTSLSPFPPPLPTPSHTLSSALSKDARAHRPPYSATSCGAMTSL